VYFIELLVWTGDQAVLNEPTDIDKEIAKKHGYIYQKTNNDQSYRYSANGV